MSVVLVASSQDVPRIASTVWLQFGWNLHLSALRDGFANFVLRLRWLAGFAKLAVSLVHATLGRKERGGRIQ